MIDDKLASVVGDLRQLAAPWALVGGLAVGARTRPRATADVDIAFAVPDDEAATHCVTALTALGFRRVESIWHEVTGRLATVRLASPPTTARDGGREVALDLFFASSGVEAETVEAAQPLDLGPAGWVPVACLGHLIAVKLIWRRSEKRDGDLRALIEYATDEDVRAARQLVAVITQRGYSRGRDLVADLEGWLGER